jgi:hypothetical protein
LLFRDQSLVCGFKCGRRGLAEREGKLRLELSNSQLELLSRL